jgi:hypothetical protein
MFDCCDQCNDYARTALDMCALSVLLTVALVFDP